MTVAAICGWAILFLTHTRVVIPRIIEAQFHGNLIVATLVGLIGLAALAWLGWALKRRIAAYYRTLPR
jgi:hypothetical protein